MSVNLPATVLNPASTYKGVLTRKSDGFRWYPTTPAWEAHNDSHWSAYLLSGSQVGTSAQYTFPIPTVSPNNSAADLILEIFYGTPTVTAVPESRGSFDWNGSTVVDESTIAGRIDVASSTLATAANLATLTTTVGTAGAGLTALAQASIWTSTIANRIDATISSRSTYAGGDTTGTTSIIATLGVAGAGLTGIPKTGYKLASDGLAGTSPVTTTYALKKNAALAGFSFVMLDSTTGLPATGKTITARRRIDGGAYAPCTNPASELGEGDYAIDLAAADTNGSVLMFDFAATGCRPTRLTIITQA